MNSVCIAVIHFTVTVGMYEQCLYCRYTFHSHSRVCMNNVCIAVIYFSHSRVCMSNVCIAVIHFTVALGYVWSVCVLLLYISVTVGYEWTVFVLLFYISDTVGYVWTMFVLPLYISQSQYGMYEQCLYCCYTFDSHSRLCMNNVCIAIIYLTVTVGYV
jgi:hypothetical protein